MSPVTIVFVVDTSASMNQRSAGGLTLIDCAKSAVEHFVKNRLRDVASKMDTFVLVTSEEGPAAIKAYDKFPFAGFTSALKTITATDGNHLGAGLRRTLDLLNLQRLTSGVDTFGLGYSPAALECATVIVLTDGTEEEIRMPATTSLGSELVKSPFRWDQRVFGIFMRMPSLQPRDGGGGLLGAAGGSGGTNSAAAAAPTEVPGTEHKLAAMCEVTGGRALAVGSLKALLHAMESLLARLQLCVVVCFEQLSPSKSMPLPPLPLATAAACRHRVVSVRAPGLWPLPEGFRIDVAVANNQSLPPREVQPTIGYLPTEADPNLPPGFPVDVYDLETCPITGFMMSAHSSGMPDSFCWQVCCPSLLTEGSGGIEPYGYLRLKRQGSIVCLHVLPYNYPVLMKLMDQLGQMPSSIKMAPPPAWRQELDRYCASIPPYYLAPLRVAFKRMGLPSQFIPEMRAEGFPPFLANYLKHLYRQAKLELEATHAIVQQQMLATRLGPRGGRSSAGPSAAVKAEGPARSCGQKEPIFSNAYGIDRADLLQQLSLLTARLVSASKSLFQAQPAGSFSNSIMDAVAAKKKEAARFSVPITIMGDYHQIAMTKAPPRNPFTDDEERNRRQRVAFGNPYKNDKRNPNSGGSGDVGMDDVDLMEGEALHGSLPNARASVGNNRIPRRRKRQPSDESADVVSPGGPLEKGPSPAKAQGLPATHGSSPTSSASAGSTSSGARSTGSTDSDQASTPSSDVADASSKAPREHPPPPDTPSDDQPSASSEQIPPPAALPATEEPQGRESSGVAVDFNAMWAGAFPAPASKPTAKQDGQKKRKAGENTVADRAGKRQALLSEVLGTEVLSGRPVEPDTRGTSDPALRLLRTFHSHREGIVDMTQAVVAALRSEVFSSSRLRWAEDLMRAAQATRKRGLEKGLKQLISQPDDRTA